MYNLYLEEKRQNEIEKKEKKKKDIKNIKKNIKVNNINL